MIIALLICVIFTFFVWLVFFKFKWLKFTAVWGVVSTFFLIHGVLAALIGLRFVTPFSVEAKVIQHTIQLVPRLSEPTLVTAVLVEPNVLVKKGQAQLAQAKQNVLILKADVDVAMQKADKAKSDLKFSQTMREATVKLAKTGAAPEEESLTPILHRFEQKSSEAF